jgi:hypothetical protein
MEGKTTHKAADVVDPGAQRLVDCCLLRVIISSDGSSWIRMDVVVPAASKPYNSDQTCR